MVIESPATHGPMPVRVGRPEGGRASAPIVIYMDAPGIRPALEDAASRLSRAGYTTVLPDLYYRFDAGDRPDVELLSAGDAEEFERMRSLIGRVSDAEVLADTASMLAHLAAEGLIEKGDWGCVGFCMGARYGLRAGSTFAETLRAAAFFHPSRLVTDEPDSPHLTIASPGAELYLGYGELDHATPLSTIPPLRAALERHGVEHRVEVFAGADHGFMAPDMPAYDEGSAERAWGAALDLFGRRLS